MNSINSIRPIDTVKRHTGVPIANKVTPISESETSTESNQKKQKSKETI